MGVDGQNYYINLLILLNILLLFSYKSSVNLNHINQVGLVKFVMCTLKNRVHMTNLSIYKSFIVSSIQLLSFAEFLVRKIEREIDG